MNQVPRKLALFFFATYGLSFSPTLAVAELTKPTPVEHVFFASSPPEGALGTIEYKPSELEQPFFRRAEKAASKSKSGFSNIARVLEYVGRFGIVREIHEDEAKGKTTLTIESKYFDGLTDSHILALSFNGSHDFQAVLSGTGHKIPPLSLVKIYASLGDDKVARQRKKGQVTRVNADFVRNWHWGTFTFISDYGTQLGSEKWRKLNQVPLDEIYRSTPDADYYEKRLGKRPDAAQTRERLLNAAGPVSPEVRKVLDRLITCLQIGRSSDRAKFNLMQSKCNQIIKEVNNLDAKNAAIAVLLQALQEDDNRIREVATSFFDPLFRETEGIIPPLVKLLKHEDPRVRQAAAGQFAWGIGQGYEDAVDALICCINDEYAPVRATAIAALSQLGSKAEKAVPTLKRALKDKDLDVRIAAADALWEMPHERDEILPVLAKAIEEGNNYQRNEAIEKIKQLGAPAVPVLIKALKDKNEYCRSNAALALGEIGPKAAAAVPALIATLKNEEDHYACTNAAEALGEIGDERAIPPLIDALSSQDDHLQFRAVGALEQFGPKAKSALPVLIVLVKEKKGYVWNTVGALGSIDTEGTIAVPVLVDALRDKDPCIRRFAAIGLARIGRNATAAEEALHRGLQDNDDAARVQAAKAYWAVTGKADEAVKVIRLAIKKNKDEEIQIMASDALKEIAPEVKSTVPENEAKPENTRQP